MKSLHDALNEAMNAQAGTLCLVSIGDCEGNYKKDALFILVPNEFVEEVNQKGHVFFNNVAEFAKLYHDGKIQTVVLPGCDKSWDPQYYNYSMVEATKKVVDTVLKHLNAMQRQAADAIKALKSVQSYAK